MPLHDLKPARGSVHKRRRIGRGQGSGRGGTSTRGHKGAQSRSGYSRKFGFEGGQQPLQRRIPKLGKMHTNKKIKYKVLNLDRLQATLEATPSDVLTLEDLRKRGLIGKSGKVKILARGDFKITLSVEAHAFSKNALAEIEKNQGKAVLIS